MTSLFDLKSVTIMGDLVTLPEVLKGLKHHNLPTDRLKEWLVSRKEEEEIVFTEFGTPRGIKFALRYIYESSGNKLPDSVSAPVPIDPKEVTAHCKGTGKSCKVYDLVQVLNSEPEDLPRLLAQYGKWSLAFHYAQERLSN